MTPLDRACRALIRTGLDRLSAGAIRIVDPTAAFVCGVPAAVTATVTVHDPRFYRSVAFGGHIGAVDAYAYGWWDTDDLVSLVRLLVRERTVLDGLETGVARMVRPIRAAAHWLNRNNRRGSRRNIRAHYDLGNEFFRTFLDDTLTYSCGIFEPGTSSLRDASIAKYDRICRRLALEPGHHVIEIGTGWGGFAIHAASEYGCRVTTTTISEAQFRFARRRVAERDLTDRITVLRADYRDVTGVYDRLVSIEMIEAVGHRFFETFFRRCAALLRPTGLAAIQSITIQDRYYDAARREVDFIKRYIFPGSCIPSMGVLTGAAGRTDLRLVHAQDIGPHYATTLRHWRRRFLDHEATIDALGFDETFRRLWEFYFSYCEGGFREGVLGDAQLIFAKPDAFLPEPGITIPLPAEEAEPALR